VSIGSAIKAASARFADAFWRGFDEARAESVARAQPAPLDTGHPLGESEEQIKATLAALIRGAFDEGVQAERKRIAEVLQAPGVASYPLLAFELTIDGVSVAQISTVIARMEVAVQARVHPTELPPIESSTPTIH
jgi:hypothetical protein